MRGRLLATWCLVVGLFGVWGGGCGPSTSGGGGRPFQGGPGGAPTAAGGVNRDPLGYTFSVAQLSSVVGGRVTALAGVPGTPTDDLAAHAPLQQVTRLSQGLPAALETTFAARAQDLVGLGTQVFAATADRSLNGVGDVFRRVEVTPGVPSWSAVADV
ncbi:MAG: hypothetical protein R3F62_22865 [Planctomycetota bacterium]